MEYSYRESEVNFGFSRLAIMASSGLPLLRHVCLAIVKIISHPRNNLISISDYPQIPCVECHINSKLAKLCGGILANYAPALFFICFKPLCMPRDESD
jgi:hypothetical protein